MSVLVTGATGFIGHRVVRALVGRGHRVRALYRRAARLDRLHGLPVETARGDLADPDSLRRALAGCRSCIHLAAVSTWAGMARPDLDAVILEGTRRLMAAAEASDVGRVVYVSSAAALGGRRTPRPRSEDDRAEILDPRLSYALAKRRAEDLVLARARPGFEVVVVQPVETYGPGDRDWVTAGSLRDALRARPALVVPGGTAIAHVDDVAAGIVAALERGGRGERYLLGGDNLTYRALVRLALAAASRSGPVLVVPHAVLGAAVAACRALALTPPVDPGLLPYLRYFWFVDDSKARRRLGYAPRPAAATLGPAVAWILEQGRAGAENRGGHADDPNISELGAEQVGARYAAIGRDGGIEAGRPR